uniref:ABC transporter domain-containing protein n=1 Tax=Leptospira ellisii TaxID=2023197 RepID=A0A2N0BB05_9LEPT|nr:hypothetical protein CH379_06285 [Leptospira ellisii]
MGRNGAGKSTLVNLVYGMIWATSDGYHRSGSCDHDPSRAAAIPKTRGARFRG